MELEKISFYFLMFMFNAKDCKFNQQWVTIYWLWPKICKLSLKMILHQVNF